MDIKPKPNQALYIKTLRSMTSEQKLLKVFELSDMSKKLFLQGLKKRFPDRSDAEIKEIYLKRIALCHNRNY